MKATIDSLIEVTDLTVKLSVDDALVHAVRGISFSLERGEVLGVVGESGAGKSMAALAMMGLLPATAKAGGSVRLNGEELLDRSPKRLSEIRGDRIAMVFQDPATSLNPVFSIGWQIDEAIRLHQDVPRRRRRQQSIELLKAVDIPDAEALLGTYPHELSGGMRQRVVIAMAMANQPEVILADEPTTALDVTVQAQVLETLQRSRNQSGAAMVLITHDLGVLAGVAEKVIVMYAGRAVERGSIDEIFGDPRMPYTIGLLGSLPSSVRSRSQFLTPIGGDPPSATAVVVGCPFAPRCPLVEQVCREAEPELELVGGDDHQVACHRRDELADSSVAASLKASWALAAEGA